VNIGSGTGSYEPTDRLVLAVDSSLVMIGQRSPASAPAIQAVAADLPIRSASFEVALAVLTIHHWPDVQAGLHEMRRVAQRQVVLTFDPAAHCTHWLTDYVPEIGEVFRQAPPVQLVAEMLSAPDVRVVPLSHDTPDGMTIAYWRRPEAYLDADVRAGGSALQQVDAGALERGLRRLEDDLASGAWRKRYRALLERETMDYGLRLVVS
jgi:SAM-dependent methyltransferase